MVELIKTKVKKWGNSYATIIPSEIINNLAIKENQDIRIVISLISNPLEALWNSGIKLKGTAQEFKDNERKEEIISEKRNIHKQ